jgi:hypothetical protein
MATTIKSEIIKGLSSLEKAEQNRVLAYIKSLLRKKSSSGKEVFLKLAGTFSETDLKEMETAIQDGCENIDRNKW